MLTFPLHVVIDAFCDNLDANFSDCYCYQQVFIQPQDVGKLRKIRIWHDNTEEHPGWFLQKVRACVDAHVRVASCSSGVKQMTTMIDLSTWRRCAQVVMEPAAGGQKLEMTVNRWLHQGKEDGDTVREIAVTWPGEEPPTGWYNIMAA